MELPMDDVVVSITVVRDEQDIIEPFVRHSIKLVDFMLVADHESVDETPRILRQLQEEFPHLRVGRAPGFKQAQSERMTSMLQVAIEDFRASFVVPLDADEFIRARDRDALLRSLRSIPAGMTGLLPWQTYVLHRSFMVADDPPRSLHYRRVKEMPGYRKVAIRVEPDTASQLVIETGSHAVRRRDGAQVPMPDLEGVALMHVPVRSHDQLVGKVITGWLATLANDPGAAAGTAGVHWRDLHDRLIACNGRLTGQELRELSRTYAQEAAIPASGTALVKDSPDWSYARKYSSGRPMALLPRLVNGWRAALQSQDGAAPPIVGFGEAERSPVGSRTDVVHPC